MKNLKKFLIIGLMAAVVGQAMTVNRAKADVPVIAVALGITVGAVLGVMLSMSVLETWMEQTTEGHKQIILAVAAEDAAAFIANDGRNATALLTQFLSLSREDLAKQGVVDPVSDLQIAQAIVAEAAK